MILNSNLTATILNNLFQVYTENVKRDEIIMDMEIFYAGDAEVSVTIKKLGFPITAGLKNMKASVRAVHEELGSDV
jgi:succinate-acetate transporter protein